MLSARMWFIVAFRNVAIALLFRFDRDAVACRPPANALK